MYKYFFKRVLDIICALLALTVFCWLYVLIAALVRVKLGSPVLFKQVRPGRKDKNGQEKLFNLYKFRTMTDERNDDGRPLPDEIRLTKFGAWLRSTSLDELPEAINILKGDMSVIGPRPQLVRDMVFMTEGQRQRHNVRPGLSGLAQVRGRNAISWEGKLATDLEYIQHITLIGDLKIVFQTIGKFLKREDVVREGTVSDVDYGDVLLKEGKVNQEVYRLKQEEAKNILMNMGEQNDDTSVCISTIGNKK